MNLNYVVTPIVLVIAGVGVASVCAWRAFACQRPVMRIVYGLLALCSMAVAVSSGFNAVVLQHFRTAPPGVVYRVHGRAMRMLCLGSGSPTLVLESGLGGDGLGWGGVQPVLAQTTRVCSYDRAGYGWSDPGPAPRDADQIAGELHGLLMAAQVDGPIVLMGHSLGGIYIRAFASRFPEQVVGLVFVDSSTPWQDRQPAFQEEMKRALPNWRTTLMAEFAYAVGVPRLRGKCTHVYPGFDAMSSRMEAEAQCRLSFATIAGEGAAFDMSGTETVGSGPFGDLPVLIFSQDPAMTAGGEADGLGKAWNGMQEDLKRLSSRSRRIVARGSSHYVQMDRAGLIESEVPRFIEEVRGGPPGGVYGSTVTE